ncbi:hypothetical protein KSP40_PGU022188 [Platanthera guangdongensis]|uniref:Maturase K n=1 Tax=Platanthera guangdongensis TaxID=2320717 RepID=A0ABR2LJ74_9ASPA
MALDGSFTCEAAILRFLARCPELRSNPKLVSLLQKEEKKDETPRACLLGLLQGSRFGSFLIIFYLFMWMNKWIANHLLEATSAQISPVNLNGNLDLSRSKVNYVIPQLRQKLLGLLRFSSPLRID